MVHVMTKRMSARTALKPIFAAARVVTDARLIATDHLERHQPRRAD